MSNSMVDAGPTAPVTDSSGAAEEDWLMSEEEGDSGAFTQHASGSNDYAMATKDTLKVQRKMYDDGYRTGITAGKETMVQAGFDAGYNQKGAPVGKKYGNLLGQVCAMEQYTGKKRDNQWDEAISRLKADVKAVGLGDLVERDWDALEHEADHGADISHIKRETDEEKRQREARLDGLQARADGMMRQLFAGGEQSEAATKRGATST